MEGLPDAPGPPMRRLLRRAVVDHADHERRRVHPAYLHVGVPGLRLTRLVVGTRTRLDPGMRTDVVSAMRARVLRELGDGVRAEPMVWLTRAGDLALQDLDAAWLAAARAAYAEAAAPLEFVVVNRRGWRDPRSGASRTWARLRVPPR